MSTMISEDAAIRRLESLAKVWPPSLWLYSASGMLCVMRKNEDGERARVRDGDGIDPDYLVTTIDIPNDGVDW